MTIDEATGASARPPGERIDAQYLLAEDAVSPDGVVARPATPASA